MWRRKIRMAWNDVEEDQLYTMGRLIAGARNKKNISLEELSQGIMSASDLKHIEDDDEYADKTTWDFLLGRLGISPLIYECYVEQEEYDLFKARKEMREISNLIISNTIMGNENISSSIMSNTIISNQIMSNGIISNENISSSIMKSENTAQLKLLADQLEERCQRYTALLNNAENTTVAIHRIFLANMKGYAILAKQRGQLCGADALKLHMESEWKRIYSLDAVSWIQKPHKVLMAVYEQEMLFLLAQGYEENGEIEKAIQILTGLWEQRKRGGDPEENTRVLSFVAWKLAELEWSRKRQEKAMEICQEAIDRSIQAESFRGLLPLLKQRLFFEKQLKWNQEEWDEQEKTIGMLDELFTEFHENPYGLFVLTTFENARIADEIIRIRRKEQNLTQAKLSEGILEPESYSRFECGKRKLRWAKKKKLLERLGERGNKVTLLLESDDPDVVEEYQRIMDCLYKKNYDQVKLMVYQLEGRLYKKSKINTQFLKYIKSGLSIYYFQVLNQKNRSIQVDALKEVVPQYKNAMVARHCWSRTEAALIKGIAKGYREDKNPEFAIIMLRRAIESYDKETIGRETACSGKQLLWETLATYLGDVAKYKEAILYAKKDIKSILQSGSAKGISDELYEIAWNEKEKGQTTVQMYKEKYLQSLELSVLFKEREYIIFLKEREHKYLV